MIEASTQLSPHTRMNHLDGIRGLAAFAVFLAHCMVMLSVADLGPLTTQLSEKIKWLAIPAVDMFFVLSGFCLMYSLEREAIDTLSLSQFWIKRILRIYPTYLTAVLFALICKQLFYRPDSLVSMSTHFQTFWAQEFTLRDLIDHVLLIFSLYSSKLNPVIWTLVVEMQMSLMFPLIAWMLKPRAKSTGTWALGVICVSIVGLPTIEMLTYFPHFAMGAVAARYRHVLIATLRTSLPVSLLIPIAPAIMLVLIRSTIYPEMMTQQARFVHLTIGFFSTYVILFTSSRQSFTDFLQSKYILFLGKISYSFFLLHFPVLLTTSMVLAGYVPVMGLWGIGLILVVLLAWLSNRYVEVPTQRLGQLLAGCLKMTCPPKPIQI